MTEPGLRLILMDIGGVILRTVDPAPRERLAAQFGLERAELESAVFHSPAAMRAEAGQEPEDAVWKSVAERFRLDAVALAAFQREFWAGDALDQHILEFLAARPGGVACALLTNSWMRDPLSWFWTFWGASEELVHRAVDRVYSSAVLGVRKPDPRAFAAVLADYEVEPGQVVFVDDFAENITAAQGLGLRTIWFRSAERCLEELCAMTGEGNG